MIIPNEEVNHFNKYCVMCCKIIMLSDLSKKEIKDMQDKFHDSIEQISSEYSKKEYDKARELMTNMLMYLQTRRIEAFGYCFSSR